MAMRTGAPSGFDRRTLYAELAEQLDGQLRRIHVGWCLNQARVPAPGALPGTPAEPTAPQQPLTAFIDEGLGGLERAVLQLELGAGRDTSTSRAALRLGPRQYARHRELGLGKLRGAISGAISGRVCDQHLQAVTLAATGDRDAADGLTSGPERCRACAREAAGLRRVLQQRLALAPWPFVIKPAGVLVAKLGALGAVLGKGGGAGLAGSATSVKVIGGVMATAALATGGIAAIESDSEPAKRTPASGTVIAPVRNAVTAPPATTAAKPATPSARARSGASSTASQGASSSAGERSKAAGAKSGAAKGPAPAATAAPERNPSTSVPDTTAAKPQPADPVREKVEDVKKTVDEVTPTLPAPVPPVVETVVPEVEKAVETVTGTVEGAAGGATGTVDGLLKP